jgi:cysteine synthase A
MTGFTDKHRADAVSDLIGHTPVVRLRQVVAANDATVWAKVEKHNPGGSIKDRIALAMVLDAERSGALSPGGTIVEPTSGNTGIGLAMVGAARGYRVLLIMPDSMSVERRQLLAAYGAELVLTAGAEGMRGAVTRAEALVAEHRYWMPNQFGNPANPDVHRRTTGPEILAQVPGPIHAFVASVGTGGTLTGTGSFLRNHYAEMRIYAVEAAASPVLTGGKPAPHKIPGTGAGFIPEVLDTSLIGEVLHVTDDEAWEMTRRLAREEGLMVGISSGAAAFGAVDVARRLGAGHTVVTILPDGGERYLSTGVFDKYGAVPTNG